MTWSEKISLKIASLNAENLFLLFDRQPTMEMTKADETEWQRLSTSIFPNKALKKVKELAQVVQDINADIIMLCEIGGPESLINFNQLFLNQAYSPISLEGNSDRSIDVGFLIKKNSPFYFDLASNKNRLINFLYPNERNLAPGALKITSHKFSRDVAELRLFKKSRDNPFLVILLTHLKSPLDPERRDPMGSQRRQAEFKTLMEIYKEVEALHPQCPVIVAGDFNGNASRIGTDVEFESIYQSTELQDILELQAIPLSERATYYQVRTGGRAEGKQIDYCFLSPKAATQLKADSAQVYRYKDEYGFAYDIPKTIDAKLNLPSDHYPLIFELENMEIF